MQKRLRNSRNPFYSNIYLVAKNDKDSQYSQDYEKKDNVYIIIVEKKIPHAKE